MPLWKAIFPAFRVSHSKLGALGQVQVGPFPDEKEEKIRIEQYFFFQRNLLLVFDFHLTLRHQETPSALKNFANFSHFCAVSAFLLPDPLEQYACDPDPKHKENWSFFYFFVN